MLLFLCVILRSGDGGEGTDASGNKKYIYKR